MENSKAIKFVENCQDALFDAKGAIEHEAFTAATKSFIKVAVSMGADKTVLDETFNINE